jgi:D-methionine transport system ATP-binding protein
MIVLDNIAKTYRQAGGSLTALDGVSFRVARGEIFGIVGHSGAGKSTLVRCLALLERPESGRIWLSGEELTQLNPKALRAARRRIGLVFQHFNLLGQASIFDNVALPLRLAKEPESFIKSRVGAALEMVHLADQTKKFPGQLSGGQKQRVGIARALVHSPEILLLDEATSALDPVATQSILQLVDRIWRETQITTVLITHEMQVVQDLCHRVGVLHGGRLVEVGAVDQVLLQPQHTITEKLVGHASAIALPEAQAAHYAAMDTAARHLVQVVRLRVQGAATLTPWLGRCTEGLGVQAKVLRGTVDAIRNTPYAQLLVEFQGEPAAVSTTLERLRADTFAVERVL